MNEQNPAAPTGVAVDAQVRPPYTARSPVVTEILKGLDAIVGRYWEPALVRKMPHTYVSELSKMIAEKLNEAA